MRKLLFVNGGGTADMQMWQEAADFWGVRYETIRPGSLPLCDLTRYALVLAVNVPPLSASEGTQLAQYAREGGRLLISGALPEACAALFGGIRAERVTRERTHRCPRVTASDRLGNWQDGDVLFFANTYGCGGKDFRISGAVGPEVEVLWESTEMAVVDRDAERWGEWAQSPEPALLLAQCGAGQAMYMPLLLGGMAWVVQPRVPTFTTYPYVVQNHALNMLIKAIWELMIGAGEFACKPLWPGGARCAVVLSGDVHDYEGIEGRADREYRDMIDNADLLREFGLDGKATFFVTGAVARKFPAEILEALERGYEICPHTHGDTCYHNAGWDYARQKADIANCIESFRSIAPDVNDYAEGFRTHGYNSDYDTRLALENLGYRYIADLQGWETREAHTPDCPDRLVTYVSLPQRAKDERGRQLDLLEIPDTVANDHFAYRISKMTAAEALVFFKAEFDRMYRLGGLYQTCLHPYVSMKEAPGREATYRALIAHIAGREDVVFLRMKELVDWWAEREAMCVDGD